MANKIPTLGEFTIPSAFFDTHEWVSDALLDSIVGYDCTLIYPPSFTECPNCLFDPSTGRSSRIYKDGGPVPFTNYTICPWCSDDGRLTVNHEETVQFRIYTQSSSWIKFPGLTNLIEHPEGYAQIIGYLTDLPKVQRCIEIILYAHVENIQRIRCKTAGEAVPHGFRKNRYFIQMVQRI